MRGVGTIYIQYIFSILSREITDYTVIYGAYIRLWPTLFINSHAWGWNHIYIYIYIYIYIRCIFSFLGREVTKYSVIHGLYIHPCPTLGMRHSHTVILIGYNPEHVSWS